MPLLLPIVAFAFFVETLAGFGSTVLTLALASHLYPVAEILPVLVPVNLLQSLYIVLRHGQKMDRALLLRRILPCMGAGLPLGLALLRHLNEKGLLLGLAAFLVAISAFELLRPRAAEIRPLPRARGMLLLLGAGILHGLYATGGPLLVYFASRQIADKSRFRSTLSTVWLVLNLVLIGSYGLDGRLGTSSLGQSALLLPPMLLGLALGEWAHARVETGAFRVLVYALLLGSGTLMLLRL